MPEVLDDVQALESVTIGIYRTAATVKGGRRFSYGALVVVGDRNGRLGMGYGKANQVPNAIEKAQKEAKRRLKPFPLQERTIPHAVTGRFGACKVRLVPASPGTGVIAGNAVRASLEMFGLQDCLTKSYGSNNPKNLIKAVLNGLSQLRSKDEIQALRGVSLDKTDVEEAIERGRAFMPQQRTDVDPMKAPQAKKPDPKKGGRGRRGRSGGRGRGGQRGDGGRRQSTDAAQGETPREAPAQEQASDNADKTTE